MSNTWTTIATNLCFLQIRPLLGHHFSQQLILQTIPGDCEVDESGLSLDLWLVVRVGKLGLDDHAKLGMILHLLVPHLDVPAEYYSQFYQLCKASPRAIYTSQFLVYDFCLLLCEVLSFK